MDDKAKKWLYALTTIVIGFIVYVAIVAQNASYVVTAAQLASHPNNCSEGVDNTGLKLAYNYSDNYCYNTTAGVPNKLYEAKSYALPLAALMDYNSVAPLCLMAGLLIGLIIWLWDKFMMRR